MKKEMLINVLQPEECRIAIVEDGILEELYVERTSHEGYTGNIYKGKVVNLEPAIQASFIDFSVGRNGFLHVSDVEPQYYARHLDAEPPATPRDRPEARRDRPDPRRPRAEDPAPPRGPDRPRDRDRPDRSERGRRDRSEPRRFGEGLLGDDMPTPAPSARVPASVPPTPMPPARPAEPAHAEPERPAREEPRRGRPEPGPAAAGWPDDNPFGRFPERDRDREREYRPAAEPGAPRGRSPRPPEPFDPDLPPSRTQRNRPQAPEPRPADFEEDAPEAGHARRAAAPFEPEAHEAGPAVGPGPADSPEREPRRGGRGRGRSSRPPVPEFAQDLAPEAAAPEGFAAPEPLEAEPDSPSEPPRRRGGRAAIRSRGGERPLEPERPRDRAAPAEPAPAPAPAPEPERYRAPQRDRPRAFEPPPPREREPLRGAEAEPPRERSRPHGRAGEPGYVPRRERTGGGEPSFGPEPVADPLDWVDLGPEPEIDADADPETDADLEADDDGPEGENGSAAGKLDGPRRRRRRRGRRRDRDRPEAGAPGATAAGDLDEDDDQEADQEADAPPAAAAAAPAAARPGAPAARRPAGPDDDDADRDFDFGDEPEDELDLFDEDEARDEFRDGPRDPGDAEADEDAPAARPEDDQIDPGLEEEIRREVEEIAELEREMGLRGTTEARPRRGEDPEPGGRGGPGRFNRGRGMTKPPIQEIFRRGDEVLVQVIKESIGTKGPTLSTYISIPGRYLVLMPGLNRVGVSRKIADERQRRKLRDIMNELNPPKGLGFIVRTAGLERSKRDLARDLAYLLRLWKVILRRIKQAKAPAPIYQESDMITRTIRDIFTSEIDTIWIDEPQAFDRAQEFLRVVMPKFVDRLKLYDERVPLFHKYGIEDEIAKIQRRHVPLPEGGSIVIDQTEALVAIDVNSGNFRVENDAERTAYEMNLRAAKEIARQLRLRDLGGVIVNDFIDMRDERHRRGVERALRDAIKRDRARSKVLRMSSFGLIEMTRQRIRPSLKRSVYEDCGNCTGAGVVKTVESMSIDVMRLLALASHRQEIRRVAVTVSTPVATYLNNRKRQDLARLESEFNLLVQIRPEEGAPAEHLQIECLDGTNSEVRLLPGPAPSHRRHQPH